MTDFVIPSLRYRVVATAIVRYRQNGQKELSSGESKT